MCLLKTTITIRDKLCRKMVMERKGLAREQLEWLQNAQDQFRSNLGRKSLQFPLCLPRSSSRDWRDWRGIDTWLR